MGTPGVFVLSRRQLFLFFWDMPAEHGRFSAGRHEARGSTPRGEVLHAQATEPSGAAH